MKTVIHIKTDKAVKEGAQKIAKEIGVPLSTVVNAQLKQFIRDKSVYLSTIPRMTPYLEKRIAQAEKDFKAGKNISPAFSSADEAIRYLERQ